MDRVKMLVAQTVLEQNKGGKEYAHERRS